MPVRIRRRRVRVAKRRVKRAHKVKPERIIKAPHQWKMVVTSKDIVASSTMNVASSGGGVTVNNAGMFTTATGGAQTTYYHAFAMFFTASTLPNASAYTALFDRYRINKVSVRFYPVNTGNNAQDSSVVGNAQFGGFLHWIIDYDDAAVPTASDVGVDTMRQRLSYKMTNIHNKKNVLSRTFKPRMAVAAYGGTFAQYQNVKAGWIDSVSLGVQHYGLKGIFEMVAPSTNTYFQNFKLEVTYWFTTKDVL